MTIDTRIDQASWGLTRAARDADNAPSQLYRGLRGVIRTALRIFYRTVEVTGREYLAPTAPGARSAPTLLASTHPNSIVDPLLLGILEERQVTFCARDGLFKVPVFGRLLTAIGAVPIARPEDRTDAKAGKKAKAAPTRSAAPDAGPDTAPDTAANHAAANHKAFAAARAVLAKGGIISIFPEGKTHDKLRVHRLRTGAARIALDAESQHDWNLGVGIVPVAPNYLVRQAFRSDVHVAFGPPIRVADLRAAFEADPRAAARELTERIEVALRDLAVHVEEAEDERIIAQVTSIMVDIRREAGLDQGGQTPSERTALVRRVLDAYHWYQNAEPERTAELRRRLQRFLEERQDLGLGGESAALQHRSETSRSRRDDQLRFLALGAPVALWGLATSAAPYATLRVLLKTLPISKDRQALTKLLAGATLFLGAWGLEIALVATLLPAPLGVFVAPLFAASLPVSAFVALRWVTEARLHRVSRGGLKALLQESHRLDALKAEREALKTELAGMRERYLATLA